MPRAGKRLCSSRWRLWRNSETLRRNHGLPSVNRQLVSAAIDTNDNQIGPHWH